MRKGKPRDAKHAANAQRGPAATGPLDRAEGLLERLRTGGANPVNAAEELDRLQAALARDESLEDVRDRVGDLCESWTAQQLRGDLARAWLTLVGGFRLDQHADQVAVFAENTGLPSPLRVQASRVLARLGVEEAADTLLKIVVTPGDVQVRTAAAEALAEPNDPTTRPALQALLDEDLPKNLWNAVSGAVDRIR